MGRTCSWAFSSHDVPPTRRHLQLTLAFSRPAAGMADRDIADKFINPASPRRSAVSCVKSAEPLEMPFGLWTRESKRNHVLDGDPDRPMGRGNFEGKERPSLE